MAKNVLPTGSLPMARRAGDELGSALRTHKVVDAKLKRGFDVLVSCIGLILLSPLFVAIGVLIKLDSSGPVFYRGERIGKGGKPFGMFKFRTMRDVPVDRGPRITAQDDPRITRLGHILRHTKLNELPQLVNVLRGEMTLVGPRPEDPQYVARYTPEQCRVLSVAPGITSIASIAYHDEESMLSQETLDDVYVNEIMPRKLELDLAYLEHRSFLVDLDVLWRTARVLSPRFVQASPEIEELLFGPVQRFIRRRLSWFSLDLLLGYLAVLMASLVWRGAHTGIGSSWLYSLLVASGAALTFTLVNQICGLQHSLWHCTSGQETIDILFATGVSTMLLMFAGLALHLAIEWIVLVGFFAGALFTAARYRKRLLLGTFERCRGLWQRLPEQEQKALLVVGAGRTGQYLAWHIRNGRLENGYRIVGFADDDLTKVGMFIHGLEVLGRYQTIPRLVDQHDIDVIAIAVDDIDTRDREAVLEICSETDARVKVIPDIIQIIEDLDESPVDSASREDAASA
jgi:lipopolysaccharide/colanic/teichoic acid biosynthesis glycosyltransferase